MGWASRTSTSVLGSVHHHHHPTALTESVLSLYIKQWGCVWGGSSKEARNRLEGHWRGGALGRLSADQELGPDRAAASLPLPPVALRAPCAAQGPPCTLQPHGPSLQKGHHGRLDSEGGATDISHEGCHPPAQPAGGCEPVRAHLYACVSKQAPERGVASLGGPWQAVAGLDGGVQAELRPILR